MPTNEVLIRMTTTSAKVGISAERRRIINLIRGEKVTGIPGVEYDTWNRALDHVLGLIEEVDHADDE